MNEKVQDKQAAQDTVFDNLGMSPEELGVTSDNEGMDEDIDTNDSDVGTPDNTDNRRQVSDEDSDDDDRVLHTEDDQRQQQRQPDQRQKQQKPLPKNAEVRADQKGNLIDASGRIVARAGKEARLYKERHQALQRVQQLEFSENRYKQNLSRAVEIGQTLHSENEKLKAQIQGISQFGLQPPELTEAAQLFSEAKANPLQTLKKLLTRAAANGIDLTQLGLQGGGDLKSFADLMRQELQSQLKPVTDRVTQERQQQEEQAQRAEQARQTQEHVVGFFRENQDALPYIEVFKALMTNERFRHMPLGEMWARIQLNVLRNGQQRQQQQNRQQPRLPNGRGGSYIPQDRSELASPNQSYDQILREVFDQHMPNRR